MAALRTVTKAIRALVGRVTVTVGGGGGGAGGVGVVVSSAEEGAEGGSMTAGGGERKEGGSVERSGEMTKKVRTQRPHRDDECFVHKNKPHTAAAAAAAAACTVSVGGPYSKKL